MGIFRKKHNDETMQTTFTEDERTGKGSRLGKWVCGSKASKAALMEDNKITQKNSSYSTSSSSEANTSKESSHGQMSREIENSLIASLPPPAEEAAFHGRPRFDWIDVVSLVFYKYCSFYCSAFYTCSLFFWFSGIPRRHENTDNLSATHCSQGNGTGRFDYFLYSKPKAPTQGQVLCSGQRCTRFGFWVLRSPQLWKRRHG